MGGWTGRGKDGIEWDGWIKSDRFIGDGSELSGITTGPPTLEEARKEGNEFEGEIIFKADTPIYFDGGI